MSGKMFIISACVLLCAGAVGGWLRYARPEPTVTVAKSALSPEEAQRLYEEAKALLEDPRVKDIRKVPGMLRQSGEAGHEGACLLLLEVYCGKRKGMGANAQAAQKWVEWLRSAPWLSDATKGEACYMFADFEEKRGTRISVKSAYIHMKIATKDYKYPRAQAELARYFMFGTGTEKDPKRALELLKKLAINSPSTPNVFFYAGYMYSKGLGIYGGPNYEMARALYEKGMKHNDARATNNLATMYEHGIGGPTDRRVATVLYQRAAALGCSEASSNMQRLAARMMKKNLSKKKGTPWSKRLAHATLRVIHALPLSASLREQLETPLRDPSPPAS